MALPDRVQQDPNMKGLDALSGAGGPDLMRALQERMTKKIVDREMAAREEDLDQMAEENLAKFLMEQGKSHLLTDEEIQGLLDEKAFEERDRQEAAAVAEEKRRYEGAGWDVDVYRNPNDPEWMPGQVVKRKSQKLPPPPVAPEKADRAMAEARRITEEAQAQRRMEELLTPPENTGFNLPDAMGPLNPGPGSPPPPAPAADRPEGLDPSSYEGLPQDRVDELADMYLPDEDINLQPPPTSYDHPSDMIPPDHVIHPERPESREATEKVTGEEVPGPRTRPQPSKKQVSTAKAPQSPTQPDFNKLFENLGQIKNRHQAASAAMAAGQIPGRYQPINPLQTFAISDPIWRGTGSS